MQTVKEISEELKKINAINSPQLASFASDERVTVKKAVEARRRQLLAEKKEEERLENLLVYERELYVKGTQLIAGVDEVGRGPLAGPVVAAAVILPENCKIKHLNDSKQIPKKRHLEVYDTIMEKAVAVGIGMCSEKVIDEINIYQASKQAMVEAILNLSVKPEHLLVDAMKLNLDIPESSLIKGDAKSMSIAAASIVAKVTRDRLMEEYAKMYPGYDFEHNAGYGTPNHLEGLRKKGITPIHRKTFSPVTSYI